MATKVSNKKPLSVNSRSKALNATKKKTKTKYPKENNQWSKSLNYSS